VLDSFVANAKFKCAIGIIHHAGEDYCSFLSLRQNTSAGGGGG